MGHLHFHPEVWNRSMIKSKWLSGLENAQRVHLPWGHITFLLLLRVHSLPQSCSPRLLSSATFLGYNCNCFILQTNWSEGFCLAFFSMRKHYQSFICIYKGSLHRYCLSLLVLYQILGACHSNEEMCLSSQFWRLGSLRLAKAESC